MLGKFTMEVSLEDLVRLIKKGLEAERVDLAGRQFTTTFKVEMKDFGDQRDPDRRATVVGAIFTVNDPKLA